MRNGSGLGRVSTDFAGTGSLSSGEMTWTLIGPVLRTSSCTTDPCTISNHRDPLDLRPARPNPQCGCGRIAARFEPMPHARGCDHHMKTGATVAAFARPVRLRPVD